MKSWRFTQAGPPRTVLGWLRGGSAQPGSPERTGPALTAAPEKAQAGLGRKHKSELRTMPHCRLCHSPAAEPGPGRTGTGRMGRGRLGAVGSLPAPARLPEDLWILPPLPSPGAPGTGGSPGRGHRWFSPSRLRARLLASPFFC